MKLRIRPTPLLLFILLLISIYVFRDIFTNPSKIIIGDDIGTHWPLIYLIKNSLFKYHSLPLWNPYILSGQPLLGNSLSMLFYPATYLFLFFPIDFCFGLVTWLHILLAGIFTYFFCLKALNLKHLSSFFAALVFMLSPKLLGHVYLGHFSLVCAVSWVPLYFLFIVKILKDCFPISIIGASVSLALMYFADVRVFFFSFFFSLGLVAIFLLCNRGKDIRLVLRRTGLTVSLTFGLIAVQFIPALELAQYSTRKLLTYWDAVIPSINFHDLINLVNVFPGNLIPAETVVHVGIVTVVLAVVSFKSSRRSIVVLLFAASLFSIVYALGFNLPVFKLLFNYVPGFNYLRVPPRILLFFSFFMAILAGIGLDFLENTVRSVRSRYSVLSLCFVLTFVNLIFYSNQYIKVINNGETIKFKENLYAYLSTDKSFYRIYVCDHSLPQMWGGSQRDTRFIDGVDPTTIYNYYRYMQKAGGYSFEQYSISTPPYQVYSNSSIYYQNFNPSPEALGILSGKYIICRDSINNENFQFAGIFDGYNVYKNNKFVPLASLESKEVSIDYYSPNRIVVSTNVSDVGTLQLNEVWYPGWKAYDNGKEVPVLKVGDIVRGVALEPGSHKIEFLYLPNAYVIGILVSVSTTLMLGCYLVYMRKKL